ncbi:hypothetical protein Tco_0592480 [Tanacetum coccineum]
MRTTVVTHRCVEIDARLDTLSIYFDEELYPHMLTAIAGRRWVIGHGMCLAMMKCAESMELRQWFSNVVSLDCQRNREGKVGGMPHPWVSVPAHHAKLHGCSGVCAYVATQGPKILLVDAATQTEVSEDKGSPRLLRSKSLPPMFNLEWL